MGYVGNTPAEKYASFAVQNFTVTATTNYTLDHPVANENDIRLVINNVVQHPGSGKAYTASGTTLTLSEATAGTDTMYCVFLGKAVQTVTPSNSSVTNAMLVSDAVNGDKIADDSISDEHLDITAITGQTEKTSLADADKFLISDSASSGALKYVQKSNLGAGTWVQITKVVNDSVGASSVEFQNCFTTTYKLYKIVCRVFRPSTDNDYCRMRLMTGTNTPVTSADYRRANTMYRSNNTTDTSSGDTDEFRILEAVEDSIAESGGMFVMYASINKSVAGSCAFKFTGTSSYTQGNASNKIQSTGVIGGFYYNNITNVNSTGFLLRSANNITEIDCTVFGMVQS